MVHDHVRPPVPGGSSRQCSRIMHRPVSKYCMYHRARILYWVYLFVSDDTGDVGSFVLETLPIPPVTNLSVRILREAETDTLQTSLPFRTAVNSCPSRSPVLTVPTRSIIMIPVSTSAIGLC